MRFSKQNEDSERKRRPQAQKKARAQETGYRIGFSFPKGLRVLSRRHFRYISMKGCLFQGKTLYMRYTIQSGPSKLGIVISRKYGKAHERNYCKRLIREAFRMQYAFFPPGVHISVSPRIPRTPANLQQIQTDFISFITHVNYVCIPQS